MVAAPPDIVRWVHRNGEDNDCVLAAMAMATGNTYEQVLSESIAVVPNVLFEGLGLREILRVLSAMGYRTRLRKKFEHDEESDDTGIVITDGLRKGMDRHAVYLWRGRPVDPAQGSRSLYLSLDGYLKDQNMKSMWLIEVKPKERT